MHSPEEIKKILDHSTLTRSIIETEVAMRKCQMYSQMAQDKEIKAFFHKQSEALEGLVDFFKSKVSEVL